MGEETHVDLVGSTRRMADRRGHRRCSSRHGCHGKTRGAGRWPGLVVGLIGALIGGAIFRLFNLWPGLESVSISLRDIVAAFIGSLIFLLVLWIVRTRGAA